MLGDGVGGVDGGDGGAGGGGLKKGFRGGKISV